MGYRPGQEQEKPGEEWVRARIPEKRKTLFSVVCVLISGLMILYGAVRLAIYTAELSDSRNTSRELQMIQAGEDAGSGGENDRTAEITADSGNPEAAGAETDDSHPIQADTGPDAKDLSGDAPAPDASSAELPEAGTEENPEPLQASSDGTASGTAEELSAAEEDSEILPARPYTDKPYLSISGRFVNLRKKGQYIVGWLSMDQVEEAVVQKDNQYFLDHDATGKKNSNGAIFLDQSVNLRTRPYTLILYGHNMKSGNMFGNLKKYRDSAYFYSHRMVSFDSMYEEGKYAVFAVMEMNTVPGTSAWYNLWSLNSNRRTDREEAIRKLERKSLIGCSLDVRPDDQLLVLVTCLDGEDERLVVAARRLRDGETENNLTIRQ